MEHILLSNAEDPEFYGQKYNQWNPELHIGCVVEGVETMSELSEALRNLADQLDSFSMRGWELAEPVIEGFVLTVWTGDGPPPKEDSSYGEDGYDLAGNHVDDDQEE